MRISFATSAGSANRDMIWNLDEARKCVDYMPQDVS